MKHHLSALLATILLIALAACSSEGPAAAPSAKASATVLKPPSHTPTPTPSPSHKTRVVPNVIGKHFAEARKALNDADFWGDAWGTDGKKWMSGVAPEMAIVTSTVPAAGTLTDTRDIQINVDTAEAQVTKATAGADKPANRYEFSCGGSWSSSSSDTYHSLQEVWASRHYASTIDKCSIKIGGVGIYDHPLLNPSEKAIADVVAAAGGAGAGSPETNFGTVLQLCTKLDSDYADSVVGRMDWKKAEATGALALCPDAPHVAILQDVATSVKTGDGTHTVGKDLEPGTYRTKPSIKDCYWSRTTGGGNIIANDFVGFAPDGVTVTVYPGEGFESQRCGVWTKIG